jgi:5-(carboxyamino)imidazole ribonucleotide synthase
MTRKPKSLPPLPPGSTIGILGGGQLGRMLALAAARLGLKTHIFSDGGDACAFDVSHAHTVGDFEDLGAIAAFARHVDVVTYEFENVPLAAARAAGRVKPVRPGPRALEVAQDRVGEKSFVRSLGLPVAPFAAVDDARSLNEAIRTIGTPAILKTRRLGYDGKGQVRIDEPGEAAAAFREIGGSACVLEGFVPFEAEASVIVVRGADGAIATYDPPRNRHEGGILRQSTVPSGLSAKTERRAVAIARAIAEGLDYVGVLGVELFCMGPGRAEPVLVNEIAPRVHNSGHWTIDACAVSQFESHIRAVAGWPLGDCRRHSDAEMLNLIGPEVEDWLALATEPGTAVHIYDKGRPRPGRKMGHVTRLTGKG